MVLHNPAAAAAVAAGYAEHDSDSQVVYVLLEINHICSPLCYPADNPDIV
jgi:hypothetical protein